MRNIVAVCKGVMRTGNNSRRGFGLELYGLLILFSTTILWAVLGAMTQLSNADQLVDSYLFETQQTFSGASFPQQHTFLLKWPLFWLQAVIGLNTVSFITCTVLIVLMTIGGLVYILQRIEKRPTVRGAIYVGLSSALLLTPTVPYAGALLPTNFAMITTRNIEYIVYIASLILFVESRSLKSWGYIGGILLTILLFVSDGLFPALSIGGAVILLLLSWTQKNQPLRSFSKRWLGAAGSAYILAIIMQKSFERLAPHMFVGDGTPYALIDSAHDGLLAVTYGILGLLTNFGANPAQTSLTLRGIPGTIASELGSIKLLPYLVNGILFCLAVFASYVLVKQSFRGRANTTSKQTEPVPTANLLALALLASSMVALISFASTKHYYVVDSRYLAVFFFSGVISIAVYVRTRQVRPTYIRLAVGLGSLAVICGCFGVLQTYHTNSRANSDTMHRNDVIVKTLNKTDVPILVGDYWRVLPIRLASKSTQLIMPLADCTTPRNTLSSSVWQPSLKTQRFAYLLTLEGGATDFPSCTEQQIEVAYGKPTERHIIAGTSVHPRELLLFFDNSKTN